MPNELIMIIATVAIIVLGGVGIWATKKVGANFISIAKSLVAVIQLKMGEFNLGSEKFDTVMDFILQGLTYVQAMSAVETTLEDKVQRAYEFIENLLEEALITLTENEAGIIQAVLKGGFIFMDYIGLSAAKVNTKNYMKLYRKTTYYCGANVVKIVGLRKAI